MQNVSTYIWLINIATTFNAWWELLSLEKCSIEKKDCVVYLITTSFSICTIILLDAEGWLHPFGFKEQALLQQCKPMLVSHLDPLYRTRKTNVRVGETKGSPF